MQQLNPWQTTSSQLVYQNPWIRVREDKVICPDGSPGIYGVVETKLATGVIALTPSHDIYLVGQYRYPIRRYSWEIIEGGAEVGEDPLAAIQRELREEAGLTAAHWETLGAPVHLSNCFSNEEGYLYLARDLTSAGSAQPEHTEVLTVRTVSLNQAMAMVDSGEITDAMTVIALLRFARYQSEKP